MTMKQLSSYIMARTTYNDNETIV